MAGLCATLLGREDACFEPGEWLVEWSGTDTDRQIAFGLDTRRAYTFDTEQEADDAFTRLQQQGLHLEIVKLRRMMNRHAPRVM